MIAWKKTEAEIWQTALANLMAEEFDLQNLRDFFGEDANDQEEEKLIDLYILSNPKKWYGARALLRKDILRNFGEEHPENIYILPSSVHELLLVVSKEEIPLEYLKNMVCAVNRDETLIKPEECLSDSVYQYICEKDKVEIVA